MNEDGLEFGTTKQFDGPEGNQYNELTLLREQERANAIKKGLIDDPDRPKALEDAQIFIGTCQDMCPMYEREQREYQNDVKRWEINPATGRIDRNLAVKAFHRPAAGNEQALPSDVRPPDVLTRTLDYLITEIVSNCDPLDKDTHGFVRDRTRSIRQDFTLQNERGLQAIDCHERIVRFHILSLHHMCEIDGFDAHQEMEQLRKTLQSLAEYYDDQQKNNVQCPNEAEFRAYHILTRMRDPDVLRHVQTLRLDVRKSSVVRQALNIYKFAQRSNEEIGRFKPPNCEGSQNLYSRFFNLIRHETTSYTVACLCETQFNDVRKGALKSMRKSFISAVKAPSVEEIVQLLGCDNVAEVVNYCEQFGIVVRADDDGVMRPILNKTSHFDESRPDLRQSFSHSLVEVKRGSLTFAQVINGSGLASSSNVQGIRIQAGIQTPKPFAGPTKPYEKGLQPDFPATARNGHQSNLVPTISTQPSFAVPTMPSTVPTKLTEASTEIPRKSSTPTTADVNGIQPVLPPSPVKPKIDLHSILASAASSVVSQLLQKHSKEAVQVSIGKVKYEREAEARKQDALLQKFSRELNHGLMNDLLYGIASECFADRWRNTHCKRAAWSVLSRTSKRVQVKRKLEAARLKAKEERDEQYADAFALLRDNQSSRNRKRRRSLPAASETATKITCVRATDIATQFWKPLDLSKLLSVFENEVTGHKLPTRWDILLYPSTASSPSTQWLATKFALDAQTNLSRSLAIRQTTVNVRLVHDVQSENCSEVGAIIFECSTDSDPAVDRVRLISLVQEVANKSDHKIVIMILRFGSIEDQVTLAKALMIPEMLADRKTPVTDCKFVSIEGMEDVVNFEHVLQDLLANISLGISALGQERHASAEQERRRKAPVPTPDEAPPLKKLRNSFYDPGPMVPRAMQRPVMSLITQQEQMPTQLAQLMQNLQSAKELLRKSVT